MNTGVGVAMGSAIGVSLGLATGQWWWIGVGMAIGAALGTTAERRRREQTNVGAEDDL